MAIFDNDLKPEEIQSGFTTDETDNENFILDAFGGKYPENMPDYDESTFLSPNNEKNVNSSKKDDSKEKNITTNDEPENVANAEIQPINEDANSTNIPEQVVEETATVKKDEGGIDLSIDEAFNETFSSLEDTKIDNTDKIAIIDDSENAYTEPLVIDDKDNIDDNKNINDNEKSQINFNIEERNLEKMAKTDDTKGSPPSPEEQEPQQNAMDDFIVFDDDFKQQLLDDIEKGAGSGEHGNSEGDDVLQFSVPDFDNFDRGAKPDLEKEITTSIQGSDNNDRENDSDDNNDNDNDNATSESSIIADKQTKFDDRSYRSNKSNKIKKKKIKLDSKMENENGKSRKLLLVILITALILLVLSGGVIGYFYLENKFKKEIEKATTTESEKLIDTLKPNDEHSEENSHLDSVVEEPAKIEEPVTQPKQKVEEPKSPSQTPTTQKRPITVANRAPTPPRRDVIPPPPKPPIDEKGAVYTIQIYSSPSKEDAEIRLTRLKERNISGGIIITQVIKDRIWYRVRFGNYDSYEDAQTAASRYGFNDAWIERIK